MREGGNRQGRMPPKEHGFMDKKGKVLPFLFLLCGAGFLLSLVMIYHITATGKAEQAAFERLQAVATEETASIGSEQTPPASTPPEESSFPYEYLKEKNPDFWAWISIDGTNLNYPVMHTPEESEYYLRRNFEKEKSQGGTPFLSGSCRDDCGNYIIYGHNMKNGTMFAALLSYADLEFRQEHPTVRLYTTDGPEEYEVLSAFYSRVYRQSETDVFRFYRYDDLTDGSVFDAYMEQVRSAALYDTGINAEYGDQLLTLVTCSYHTDNGRFVVVARKYGEPSKIS